MTDPSQFWNGRRVALTGATGFLGDHLARRLLGLGARVTALVRPQSACERLQSNGVACVTAPLHRPDLIPQGVAGCDILFHLAGAVDFQEDWPRFWETNLQGTRNVLSAAQAAGVRRVVHTSSIVAVGGTIRPRILDETAAWNLRSLRVPYVTTKRRAEEAALGAARAGQDVVVVNPACIVGPEDHAGSEFGTMCRRFWQGRIPFFFGGGNNFVDVRDVAEGMVRAAQRGRAGERYLLAGHNRSFTALFADLARLLPGPSIHLRLPMAVAHLIAWWKSRGGKRSRRPILTPAQARLLPLYFYFDSSKAGAELGYSTRPLAQTLADTYAFWSKASNKKAA